MTYLAMTDADIEAAALVPEFPPPVLRAALDRLARLLQNSKMSDPSDALDEEIAALREARALWLIEYAPAVTRW